MSTAGWQGRQLLHMSTSTRSTACTQGRQLLNLSISTRSAAGWQKRTLHMNMRYLQGQLLAYKGDNSYIWAYLQSLSQAHKRQLLHMSISTNSTAGWQETPAYEHIYKVYRRHTRDNPCIWAYLQDQLQAEKGDNFHMSIHVATKSTEGTREISFAYIYKVNWKLTRKTTLAYEHIYKPNRSVSGQILSVWLGHVFVFRKKLEYFPLNEENYQRLAFSQQHQKYMNR